MKTKFTFPIYLFLAYIRRRKQEGNLFILMVVGLSVIGCVGGQCDDVKWGQVERAVRSPMLTFFTNNNIIKVLHLFNSLEDEAMQVNVLTLLAWRKVL